jgi:multidrug efflux pump subunit AcrB
MNLTQFTVKNYQFTLILALMAATMGVVTLLTMPRAEDPQINPPSYVAVIVYPGTGPKDMEELVVKPIEEKIYGLENIDKLVTTIEDGLAVMQIDFRYGADIDNKYQEVVREINSLRSSLPADIYSIDITRVDPSDVNILQVALVSENASYRDLRLQAEALKDQLEKVNRLKKVKVSGAPEEVIHIALEIDKIAGMGIPLHVVLGSIQGEALNIPGGRLTAGTRSFNVKTSGKYTGVDEIAATPIFNANGKLVQLRDVASVGMSCAEEKHITRFNGHRCVLVDAALKNGENITSARKQYSEVLDAFEAGLPANIAMRTHFDQAEYVSLRLSGLGIDFMIAIALVLITLLPIGTRASLVVMLAIPLSLALGLIGLNALGYSLNQLSIVGLVLALGLLVDDSIVVVENIERWLREGHSKKVAAIKATKQITNAVLGFTATLIIAFLPLLFLPGPAGEFVRGLPMAVVLSVLASMLVSLTVVPFIASRFLKEHHNAEGNVFLRLLKKAISKTYAPLMAAALHRPALTLVTVFVLFIGAVSLFPIIGFKLFPTSEKPMFMVNVQMPQQTSMQRSNEITRMVEDSLRRLPSVVSFTANVGKGNPVVYYNVRQQGEKFDFAQLFIQLHPSVRPGEKQQLINHLRAQFSTFPHARVEVRDFEQGPPVEAPISIRVIGDNLDSLRQLSFQVENILRSHPGTIYVNNELNTLKTDIRVNIDREKARTYGVLTADIDRTVRLAVAGLPVGTYTDSDGDEYDIVVHTPRDEVSTLSSFDNLIVNNVQGVPVALSQMATLGFETSPTSINHRNKTRFVKVTSFTQKGVLANDVLNDVVPQLESLHLPKGYTWQLAGEAENEDEAFGGNFLTVILLSVFLFIAVLILQFKNFKGILIVLSVIPLGVIGGVSMLWLSGNPMSFVAIIGFIGLAGIEIKNSILLVDFTNQLRRDGVPLLDAIAQAGEVRFLPVVLTALTAIGGFMPLALNSNPLISPLALVLIGGLLSSTLLSRIVTPVMYKLMPPKLEGEAVAGAPEPALA